MRQSIKDFVELVVNVFSLEAPVYEFGSRQVESQIGWADLRPYFSFVSGRYIGCDLEDGPGVDRILDVTNTDLDDVSVGTILMLDTLEHVEYLRLAMEECYRILKPEGIIIISSVMAYPIHEYPCDYWRFTPQGFESLLQQFSSCIVDYAGPEDLPHTIVGIGAKRGFSDFESLESNRLIQEWKESNYISKGRNIV